MKVSLMRENTSARMNQLLLKNIRACWSGPSRNLPNSMIHKISHQEIQASKPSIEEVKQMPRMPLYLVLDNIRSIYNVGAMFRTCDAVLAQKIFLCGITGHPPRKDIDKVALGAVEVVPWEYSSS